MMKRKLEQLDFYFDEQISLCGQRRKKLLADDRGDEADFEKVKANVYDIFRTILSVAVKTYKDDGDAVKRFFLLKAEQIPENWAISYDKAKQHGDMVKMQIESIKIDTIGEIRERFTKIWEGEE